MHSKQFQLPPGFKDLASAWLLENEDFNVMGIVVDWMQPATTPREWQARIGLHDPSSYTPHLKYGRLFKYFAPRESLPRVQGIGDVVLIRNIKRISYKGREANALSNRTTETLVFPAAQIPDPSFVKAYRSHLELKYIPNTPRAAAPSQSEQMYAIKLRQWAVDTLNHSANGQTGPNTGLQANQGLPRHIHPANRYSALVNVKQGSYYDLIGQVVKIYIEPSNVQLYLTDYTKNSLFFNYAENREDEDGNRGWQGPPGKQTIQIHCYPPHSQFIAESIREGNDVFLRNVRIKITERSQYLTGTMHGDTHMDVNRVNIRLLRSSDPGYEDYMKRKKKYEANRAPRSKTSKKNERKRIKKQQEKEAAQKQAELAGNANKFNPNVISKFKDHPITLIYDLLHSPDFRSKTPEGRHDVHPFTNIKCKLAVRVVDFYPPNLDFFGRRIGDAAYGDANDRACADECSDNELIMSDAHAAEKDGWEWFFYLLVEDAEKVHGQEPIRLKLLVHGSDAEFLLNMKSPTTDLRHDPERLKALRDKLFLLWGNLEELKRSGTLSETIGPKNRPFVCCAVEYGVRDGRGWRRIHRLVDTTIQDK